MRKTTDPQRTFEDQLANWEADPALAEVDRLLDKHPSVYARVAQDLSSESEKGTGQPGLQADQVLRAALVMQWDELSYRDLTDRIDDSLRLRAFCRFGNQPVPAHNTLQENIRCITAETWQQINAALVGFAVDEGVEDGQKVRFDSTAVETNIHYPTDARLIEDCVRVALRLMSRSREEFGHLLCSFNNRMRAVKSRVFEIPNRNSTKEQGRLYRELLKLADEVKEQGGRVRDELAQLSLSGERRLRVRDTFLDGLTHLLEQFAQVLDQCRRRVIHGEKVPASEKILSIFEPHTDIIAKGGRETVFGHKIWLSGGASNLILDCIVERGNGSDSGKFAPSLARTAAVLGRVPEQIATDDGYASQANAEHARSEGVRDVTFGGKLKNELTHWVRSARVQRKLRNFRAGIEAVISGAKRTLGLDRCKWSGWDRFRSYVWLSVVAWNLQTLGRRLAR